MSMTHAHDSSSATSETLIRGSRSARLITFAALVVVLAGTLVGLGSPAHATSKGSSLTSLRSSVLAETNEVRGRAGCRPLKYNGKLTRAAQGHANDLARSKRMSHRSSNGQNWPARIRKQGFGKPGAENLAVGFDSAADVVRAWLGSPVHRRNLHDCRFKRIGIGFSANGEYWVQDFGF